MNSPLLLAGGVLNAGETELYLVPEDTVITITSAKFINESGQAAALAVYLREKRVTGEGIEITDTLLEKWTLQTGYSAEMIEAPLAFEGTRQIIATSNAPNVKFALFGAR